MLPVFRWCLCGLGALWTCAALAQTAASQPEIDESKIPEWVKRQARSPYKVIIDSNAAKAKAAPAKDDANAKLAPKKLAAKPAAAAAATETEKRSPPAATAAPAPAPAPSVVAARPALPESTSSALAVPAPAAVATLEIARPAPPEPETRSARVTPTEPPALALLKRVEPVLSADLLDSRLSSAKVVVAFTVTANGEVANLAVASTTDSRLNRSVLRAVQAWRYAPIPEPREHMVSFAFTTE